MNLLVTARVSPAPFGGPDLHELHVLIEDGRSDTSITKLYPLEFWQSHFRIVWKSMGEEFERHLTEKGGESE